MTSARVARLVVAFAIGFVPVACSAVPSPTTSPATSQLPSPAVSGSVAPVSPEAPPPGRLAEWQQVPLQGDLRDALIFSVVAAGDRFLGLGCTKNAEGCEQPAIWESADGLGWRTAGPVFVPPTATWGRIAAVSSSRFGTLAVGSVGQGEQSQASIWLRDGGGWTQFSPPSAADSHISALLATDDRLIAIGGEALMHFGGFKAWWSADGRTWQAAPPIVDKGGYPTDLLPVAGAAVAWGEGCGGICPPVPSAWWLSVDGTAWQSVEAPRGLEDVWVTAVARTDGGFAAFGFTALADAWIGVKAWTADDTAADWRSVEPPPARDDSRVVHHLVVGGGSVAAGFGGVGLGPNQSGALVWLRGPGESAWRAPMVIPDLDILALAQSPAQPNRVIVLGQTLDGIQMRLVIWTGLVDWAA